MKKKKLVRSLFFLVTLVGVLFIAGAIGLSLFADSAVRVAVESAGAKTLGVGVDVGKADLAILGGSVTLRDITVANPPGYEGECLVDLARTDISADTLSLLGDQAFIRSMKLDGMEVFVEQKGLTQNNLYEVVEKVRRDRKPSGKRLVIDVLEITHIRVNVELQTMPGRDDRVTFELSPIRMTDLGRDEDMDVAILLTKILLAVATEIAEEGTDVLPREMIGDLSTILNKAIDIGRIIFGNNGSGSNSKDGADNGGPGISEGLKNLLKPKDAP